MLTNPEPDAEGIAQAALTLEALAGAGNPSPAMRRFQLWVLRGATHWLLGRKVGQGLQVPDRLAGYLLPVLYFPVVRVSEAIARWRGEGRGEETARAMRKLALGNATIGAVPQGAGGASALDRLEALARFQPGAPAT